MKLLLYVFMIISMSGNFFLQNSKKSLKIQIRRFEKMVFNLRLNNNIDTTATYVSIFKIENYSNITNGRNHRKKDYSYMRYEKDTVLGKKLLVQSKMILTSFINSKNVNVFKKIEKNNLYVPHVRFIIEFDNRYLLIRTASLIYNGNAKSVNTESGSNLPCKLFERYIYYKRLN